MLLKDGWQTELGVNGMVAQLGAVGGIRLGQLVKGSSYSVSVLTLANIIGICFRKIYLFSQKCEQDTLVQAQLALSLASSRFLAPAS